MNKMLSKLNSKGWVELFYIYGCFLFVFSQVFNVLIWFAINISGGHYELGYRLIDVGIGLMVMAIGYLLLYGKEKGERELYLAGIEKHKKDIYIAIEKSQMLTGRNKEKLIHAIIPQLSSLGFLHILNPNNIEKLTDESIDKLMMISENGMLVRNELLMMKR